MQLTLDHKDLVQATTVVASLLKRSATTLPVLSNLLIDAEGDRAVFIGTDLESHVKVNIPAKITGGSGKITLPADKLSELVSLLPAGAPVDLVDEGGQVAVSSESLKYHLVTLPPDDYPRWNVDTAMTRFHVPQKQLRRLIDAIHYAIPTKDHRRVLMGGLFELREDTELRLTATDGKKLSRISAQLKEVETGGGDMRAVVSGRLLGDLRKVLLDEGSVTVEIGDRQVSFLVDNIEYRTNLIDGKYPDCDAVIPKDFPYAVRINREQFLVSARRAGVTSDDRNKSIILKFEDNKCEFTSMAADVGTYSGALGVEYDGTPLEIAFNYELLIQTLNSFSRPDIHVSIKSEQAPCVFRSEDEPEHLCVLMPIKLSEARRPGGAE